jgi:hypothetical protein
MKSPFRTHRTPEERCAMMDGFLGGLIVMSVTYCLVIVLVTR